ncbi:MAG TPA: flagellar export chaperone FliS [Bryobacteraceae bacterium]|nr:flagellar export chaperone FliS [Bryobacteraceae bacterium]HOL71069.1 flagellar export chaperone FliS [Bryobacteraceae bacterium]HOQ43958.1 flagellar export chaperone FliS [Bryobacteraceae bacterium]HPQ15731.1 flagellar export chaperone FliS [Bryobacteraceae bacterium]HPU72936.1 flagellar export chaperone FliS [Bryobacteraceae bacterium]
MASSAQDIYLESRILSADGVELVRILYQAALESVEKARRHLREGDIAARSREINRATAVLTELTLSLDLDAGGALSRNLLELYDYMQRRLLEANFLQSEPILAEVSRLLATLLEGWMNCHPETEQKNEVPVVELAPDYGGMIAVSY